MSHLAARPPILFAGYALFVIVATICPLVIATEAIPLTSHRVGLADSFTVLITHMLVAISFFRVMWLQSTAAVIDAHGIRNMVLGVVLESVGWVLQRAYWTPWYLGQELGWIDVVDWLQTEVWVVSFAYVVIWIGAGLSANIVFRTWLGPAYHWWPLAWLGVIASAWIVGYQLPDIVHALAG